MKHGKRLLALNLALLLLLTAALPPAAAAGIALRPEETVTGSEDGEYTFTPEKDGDYRLIFKNSAKNKPGGTTSASLNLWGQEEGSGHDDSWEYDRIYSLKAGTSYAIRVHSTDWQFAGSYTLQILPGEKEEESPSTLTFTEVAVAKYSYRQPFSQGLAAVWGDSSVKGENGRSTHGWGFIDRTGTEVIPCQYEEARDFSEGLAAVRLDSGKWGFIDKTGVEVIPGKYDSVDDFHEGLAGVMQGNLLGFVDQAGNEAIPCDKYCGVGFLDYQFSEGLAAVQDGETTLWGYVDKTGREVVPCRYDGAKDFSDGLAQVMIKEEGEYGLIRERWGYIDQTGKEIIPCQYSTASKFVDGYAVVSEHDITPGGHYIYGYIIDKGGKTRDIGVGEETGRILRGASSYDSLEDGLLLVRTSDVEPYTYMDTNGSMTRFENYWEARKFSEGMAAVYSKSWGFINTEGKTITSTPYGEVGDFHEGLAWVKSRGERGYIDKSGREVVAPGYDTAGDFSDGVAWVSRDDNYMLLLAGDGADTAAAPIPSTGTAYAATQTVEVDGEAVLFECYALKDERGNPTNYIKLRDIASVLNHTAAQFEVGWSKSGVTVTPGQPYTPNGSEMSTPFSGDRSYEVPAAQTWINGAVADLQAIVLADDRGGQYTYYKLRDLGGVLGFKVDWSPQRGVFIETGTPL